MRAILANIHTHEISAIAEVETFAPAEDELVITEDQWEAEPQPDQVWAGNIPATFTTPYVPVPSSVTKRQAKLALLEAGLFYQVEQTIAAMPSPMKDVASIEWNDALTFERASPWIANLGGALGLTDAQIDALFIAGAKL